ncbi:MAG: hypothetical protein H6842_10970 [Rhodospirillaceae bacterium]|nr:hypothetical protein [Rhodospirillaceae bacterium]
MRCPPLTRWAPCGVVAGILAAAVPAGAADQSLHVRTDAVQMAQTAEPAAEDPAAIVSGNTLSGWRLGSLFVEYYDADGAIRGKSNNALYSGTWRTEDGRLCVDYDFGAITDFDICGTLVRASDGFVVLLDAAGTEHEFEWQAGNPEEL